MAAAVPKRNGTAKEGVALLKRGSTVKKYGRQGKPHATLFRLSDDESMLGWEGRGLNKLKRRAVRICDLVELHVGHESTVFLEARAPGAEHMSMSLRLLKAQSRPDDDARDGDGGAGALLRIGEQWGVQSLALGGRRHV